MPIESHIRDTNTNRAADVTDSGRLLVDVIPPDIQQITGSVIVGNVVEVSGTLNTSITGTIQITGTVAISNVVSITGTTYSTVTGTVSVSNLPSTQSIIGVVTASVSNFPVTQSVSGFITASISNFPAIQTITGTVHFDNLPITQSITGTVAVNNFPGVQNVLGTASISNFPAIQAITGTIHFDNISVTQSVTGTVHIDNFPTVQIITGTIGITNFPAIQSITGTVNVNDFPATQSVSAVSWPLPTGAATEVTLATRATEATLSTRVADATITARLGVLGQSTMAGSTPVVIASNQSILLVTGTTSISNFPSIQLVNIEGASSFLNISTNAAFMVKSSSGTLRRIIVSNPGAGANILTIKFGASIVGIIDTSQNVFGSLEYNLKFTPNLQVTSSSGTAGNITIIYD